MAEEQIIIEVVVDNSAATKALKDQTKAVDDLTNANKEIQATNKELNKDYAKNSTEINRNNVQIAKNKDEISKANAARKTALKDLNTENSSINSVRASLAKNTKERNNLNTATKQGQAEFKRLTTVMKSQSDQLKELEGSAGDFRRNVGDYKQAFTEASSGIKVFGTDLNSVFNLIKGNPIVLLISALTGLIAVFAKSQTGIEFFRKTGAALNATFGLLIDSVEALGIFLIDAFSNPQQALDDLVDNIKNGIVFYFTEFIPNAIQKVIDGFGLLGKAAKLIFEGEFSKAADVAGEAVLKLGDGLTDLNPVTALVKTGIEATVEVVKELAQEIAVATTAAFGLESAMIANEKAIADQQVTVAQSIKSQKELNLLIEDQTASIDDRIAAGEKFAQVEQAQITESIRLQEERIRLLKAQNDITNSTEEDIQRVRDAEIELANLQAASLERQVTNQNKLNTVRQQGAAIDAKIKADQEAEDDAFFAKNDEIRAKKKEQDEEDAQDDIDLEKTKADAKVGLASSTFQAVGAFAEEGSAISKAAAIGSATVNTYQAITNALANIPAPFNIAAAGVTGALGFAQVAKIGGLFEDGGITKFANGGLTNGGMFEGASHANGGVKFAVGGKIHEAEGGEAIISKRATAMFKPQLSAMNVAGGGKKFATGGIPLASSSTAGIDSAMASEASISNTLSSQGDVQVAVTDINRTQSSVSVKQSRARI